MPKAELRRELGHIYSCRKDLGQYVTVASLDIPTCCGNKKSPCFHRGLEFLNSRLDVDQPVVLVESSGIFERDSRTRA